LRGSGDSSPRDMAKGYDQGNMPKAWTRGRATSSPSSPFVLGFPWCLIAFGSYPRLVVSSWPKGPSSRLYSQRLRSKAMFRFASPALSLTRRPTHWPLKRRSAYSTQSFLGKIFLEALLPSCVDLQISSYVHRRKRLSSSSIGLRFIPGILCHSSAVRLIVLNHSLVRSPWKRCCFPASISIHHPMSIVERGYLSPL
jgi:hypothetical protein